MTFLFVLLGLVGWSVIATIEVTSRDGHRRAADRMWESRLEPRLPGSGRAAP